MVGIGADLGARESLSSPFSSARVVHPQGAEPKRSSSSSFPSTFVPSASAGWSPNNTHSLINRSKKSKTQFVRPMSCHTVPNRNDNGEPSMVTSMVEVDTSSLGSYISPSLQSANAALYADKEHKSCAVCHIALSPSSNGPCACLAFVLYISRQIPENSLNHGPCGPTNGGRSIVECSVLMT